VYLSPSGRLSAKRPGAYQGVGFCVKLPAAPEFSGLRNGVEMDLVTHDILKFFTMLLKRNGYVLEQLHSPLVVQTSPEHEN